MIGSLINKLLPRNATAAVTTESVMKLVKNLLLTEKAERSEKQKEEARQRASRWTTEAALCSLT